ncbi:MAG: hypothetical protein V9E88_06345 [Ferruginibacter sp.]
MLTWRLLTATTGKNQPSIIFISCWAKSNASSVFIFDDIHWSAEMEEAWEEIRKHPAVTLSIDLFFIGLVFFDPSIKVKQEFVIQF